jgi:hypothetical protein
MSRSTQPKDTSQEAHNRGGLEDNYRSNLVNRASTIITDWIFHVNPTPLAYKRRGRGGLNPMNHNTTDAQDVEFLSSRRPEPE